MRLETAKKLCFSSWGIAVFFLILTAIAFYPFFFQGKLILSGDSDALFNYYPAFDFYSKSLKDGESFLWNPLLLSGFPTYLSQTAGFLDPLNLLIFSFFPSVSGYHLRLFIDIFLTLFFSYLAGRALGLSRASSTLIGPGYVLAFHWRFISNLVIANSLFLMPFLIFTLTKALDGKRNSWLWASFAGAGAGWSFLSGYAQPTVYALILAGLYALLHYWFISSPPRISIEKVGEFISGGRSFAALLRVLGFLSVMLIVSFLIGLPQILPSLEFVPHTLRAEGVSYSSAILKSVEFGDLIYLMFPDYLTFPYIAAGRKPLYVGAFLFLMALAAIPVFRKNRRATIISGPLLFSFIASISYFPLYYVFQQLPVLSYFRFPYRWMYLGVFFLALLGAYGFDALEYLRSPNALRRIFKAVGVLIAGVSALFIAVNFGGSWFWDKAVWLVDKVFSVFLYGNFGYTKDPFYYKDALGRGVDAWREIVSFSEPSFLAPFLLLLVSYALAACFIYGRLGFRFLKFAGTTLGALTFLTIFAVQWPQNLGPEVINMHSDAIYNVIPAEDRGMYRSFPFDLDRGFMKKVPPKFALTIQETKELSVFQHSAGRPNMHFYSGISSVDGYEPFVTRDMQNALWFLGSTYGGEGGGASDEERRENLLSNLGLLGMMAGKYIISGIELTDGDLRFLKKINVTLYDLPFYVYENKKALPRVYFAKKTVNAPGKSVTEIIEDEGGNFADVTYLDCAECRAVSGEHSASFEVVRQENGLLEIDAESSGANWLVFSESFLPGWRVEIDGREAAIIRANGLYMAVFVDAGQHSVVFEYNGIAGEAQILKKLGIIKTR